MSQEEIINFLKTQKEPLTSGEIAELMNRSKTIISRTIRTLLKYNDVSYLEIDRIKAMKRCGSKRRIFLYFVE